MKSFDDSLPQWIRKYCAGCKQSFWIIGPKTVPNLLIGICNDCSGRNPKFLEIPVNKETAYDS